MNDAREADLPAKRHMRAKPAHLTSMQRAMKRLWGGVIPMYLVAKDAAARETDFDGHWRRCPLCWRARSAVNRQDTLVRELLYVSRMQSGKLTFQSELFDLAALVREVMEDQQMVRPRRSLSIAVPETAVLVLADRDHIGQVMTNYLANALKYSGDDRPVWVSLTTDDGAARSSVRDEGPGITSQERERVWERFYRAPSVKHKSGSEIGLGLGLHISKTIVERHGGAVGVESQPSEGSIFWFTLPLAD